MRLGKTYLPGTQESGTLSIPGDEGELAIVTRKYITYCAY